MLSGWYVCFYRLGQRQEAGLLVYNVDLVAIQLDQVYGPFPVQVVFTRVVPLFAIVMRGEFSL